MGPDKLGDEFPEMIPPVLAVLPTFAGDNFYHIAVGQPDDQDFSIRSLLPFPEEFPEEERSEEVMWIQLANVKPGKRERFLQLRKRLLAKLANSPVITAWYTFDMDVGRGVGPLADQVWRTTLLLRLASSSAATQQNARFGNCLCVDCAHFPFVSGRTA